MTHGIRRLVCEGLCAYHKPGRVEEPGCGGLVRLARCEAAGELLRDAVSKGSGGDALCGLPKDDPRLLEICTDCEYFVDGCDFRDPEVKPSACSPCGGLKAAAIILSNNPKLLSGIR